MSTKSEREPIPLCVPELRGREWEFVKECLDTNWVSSVGGYVDRFEKTVADRTGCAYGVATVNGTAALHVALLVVGVKPEDEVLVSTMTFVAPANAIRYAGAWPVFMDAEPAYWQMDVDRVAEFLAKGCTWQHGKLVNRATGRRVAALLPVHILGHPVHMERLLEVARQYGLPVIEDASESLGARCLARRGSASSAAWYPCGCLGDIACFSFNGNKIVTTGGGGMIVTDNADWARQAKYLTTQAKDDGAEYIHRAVGFNYRLTNVQAAIGCAQMEQLDDYVEAKRGVAEAYSRALSGVQGLTTPRQADWAFHTFWMYTVMIDPALYGTDSRGLMRRCAEARIQTRPLWQPMHLSPAHAGAFAHRCEVAERLYARALSLPCSVGLKPQAQDDVIRFLQEEGRENH